MKVSGLAAIVTGGASGLGGAVAQLLADAGANVTIFDLNEQLGAAKAAQIKAHFIAVDVVDEVAVENALQEAQDMNGTARVLVNCAGIGPPGKVIDRNGNPLPLSTFGRIVNRPGGLCGLEGWHRRYDTSDRPRVGALPHSGDDDRAWDLSHAAPRIPISGSAGLPG